jgi:hypothetical protein
MFGKNIVLDFCILEGGENKQLFPIRKKTIDILVMKRIYDILLTLNL